MAGTAIRVIGLGKRYQVGARRSATLRDAFGEALVRIMSGGLGPAQADTEFWALKDVSFEVRQGEVVGVIGRNGAGKSTLLKILSRVTEPAEGRVELFGRVGSLLEVGTGFHPDLTGRENVFLNGSILGMKRAEIDRKFDEIIAFAELEQFVSTPVKHYSSGMYMRLAFAVAAHLETEILIIDEVLAVGDAEFQSRCLDKMGEVSRGGRTVLFVSHNLSAVQGLCGRAIWLAEGKIAAEGSVGEVVSRYLDAVGRSATARRRRHDAASSDLEILDVVVRGRDGKPTLTLDPWEPIDLQVAYSCRHRLERPGFWISVESQFGSMFGANMLLDGDRPAFIEGEGSLGCRFDPLGLMPQSYTVWVGARDASGVRNLLTPEPFAMFSVVGSQRDYGFRGDVADSLLGASSPLLLPYEWCFPDGRTRRPGWMREEEGRL